MSKENKANKSNYVQAGRLTPDEAARERAKQAEYGGRNSYSEKHDPAPTPDEGDRPRSAPKE